MYPANMITAIFQVSLLILGPLLVPVFLKKWIWFGIVGIGYLAYAGIGFLLFTYEDVESFGPLYGMAIPLFLGFITIAGLVSQLITDRLEKGDAEQGNRPASVCKKGSLVSGSVALILLSDRFREVFAIRNSRERRYYTVVCCKRPPVDKAESWRNGQILRLQKTGRLFGEEETACLQDCGHELHTEETIRPVNWFLKQNTEKTEEVIAV